MTIVASANRKEIEDISRISPLTYQTLKDLFHLSGRFIHKAQYLLEDSRWEDSLLIIYHSNILNGLKGVFYWRLQSCLQSRIRNGSISW